MHYFTRFLMILLLVKSSSLFGVNSLNKALVKKDELQLFFSNNFNKKDIKHIILKHPYRDVYDFKNTHLAHKRVPLGLGKYVKIAQNRKNRVRIVILNRKKKKSKVYRPSVSKKKYHITLPKGSFDKEKVEEVPPFILKKLKASSSAKKLIVIDAGHGGHDSGAKVGKLYEKDIVLAIAKKSAKELKKLGYRVYLTRNSNRFLTLKQRTHIADSKNAQAFISIHANSASSKAQGVETYFLQNTRDKKSQRIATRENSAVLKGAVTKLSKKILVDAVLNGPKIVESNKLALDVQSRIIANLRRKYRGVVDRGVRHGPFYVLVGASRPSILVETGYISHKKERKRLFSSRYQSLIAKGIAQGVNNYLTIRNKEVGF